MAETIRSLAIAAPGLWSRGGFSLSFLLVGCSLLQSEPEGPRTIIGAGRTSNVSSEVVQDDGSLRFDDDPFAVAGAEPAPFADGGYGGTSMIIPFEQLDGLDQLEAEAGEAGVLELNSELSLTMLRARAVADELGRTSRIVVDPGPHTFGDSVRVRLESRNPYGELLQLLPSEEGLVVEMTWEIVRWLPIQGYDRVLRRHWFKLPRVYALDPDQDWWEETTIPLDMEGESGGLWQLRIGARIRCAGVQLGDAELPIHEIRFGSGGLLALPPGWQQYRSDPLSTLDRLAAISGSGADRHVLVCVALLEGRAQRQRGLELLLDHVETLSEEDGISERRAITFCTALQWLTGLEEDMSNFPPDWIAWRERVRSTPQDSGR